MDTMVFNIHNDSTFQKIVLCLISQLFVDHTIIIFAEKMPVCLHIWMKTIFTKCIISFEAERQFNFVV